MVVDVVPVGNLNAKLISTTSWYAAKMASARVTVICTQD
jgi:hypothetical protein